jgi:AraC-like DNA-binding protein
MSSPPEVPAALLPHLMRARDLADREYSNPLDIDRLAAEASTSKYHFIRSFAATYGETPMRYLTRRRMERAQDLLRTTNLTVTEICTLVGYSSLGTFSTRFSEMVGCSPSTYQQRYAGIGGRIPGCMIFMYGLRRNLAIPEKHRGPDST